MLGIWFGSKVSILQQYTDKFLDFKHYLDFKELIMKLNIFKFCFVNTKSKKNLHTRKTGTDV